MISSVIWMKTLTGEILDKVPIMLCLFLDLYLLPIIISAAIRNLHTAYIAGHVNILSVSREQA